MKEVEVEVEGTVKKESLLVGFSSYRPSSQPSLIAFLSSLMLFPPSFPPSFLPSFTKGSVRCNRHNALVYTGHIPGHGTLNVFSNEEVVDALYRFSSERGIGFVERNDILTVLCAKQEVKNNKVLAQICLSVVQHSWLNNVYNQNIQRKINICFFTFVVK